MSAPVSTLTGWAVMPDGEVVKAITVAPTLDERWSPYVQGAIEIPYTADRYAALDPRPGAPRVRVGIRRAWAGRPLALDLSAEWAGMTAADLSAEWAGMTAADLSAGWLVEWESGDRAADTFVADLAVRSRRRHVDATSDTLAITVASDELLAQGAHVLVTRPAEPLPDRIRALLAAAGITAAGFDLAAGIPFMVDALDSAVETFKSTVWALISGPSNGIGQRLYCDENRVWHLVYPTAAPSTTVEITRVSQFDDESNVDSDYADAYVFVGTAINVNGDPVTNVRSDPAELPTGPLKIALDTQDYGQLDILSIPDEFLPSTAEIAARGHRLRSQGRTLTFTAPADPTARPQVGITTGAPSLPDLDGVIAAVTFHIPEDTMTITTRDTIEAA